MSPRRPPSAVLSPVALLVTEDFEVGLRFCWGINDSSPDFFTNVGVGVCS